MALCGERVAKSGLLEACFSDFANLREHAEPLTF